MLHRAISKRIVIKNIVLRIVFIVDVVVVVLIIMILMSRVLSYFHLHFIPTLEVYTLNNHSSLAKNFEYESYISHSLIFEQCIREIFRKISVSLH